MDHFSTTTIRHVSENVTHLLNECLSSPYFLNQTLFLTGVLMCSYTNTFPAFLEAKWVFLSLQNRNKVSLPGLGIHLILIEALMC